LECTIIFPGLRAARDTTQKKSIRTNSLKEHSEAGTDPLTEDERKS